MYCHAVLREHWQTFGCPSRAVLVYRTAEGERVGWCLDHVPHGQQQAARRGWQLISDLRPEHAQLVKVA